MKCRACLILILTHSAYICAQSQPADLQLLQGWHFGFKLSNGFNTTRVTSVSGDSKLKGGLVHQHAVNVELLHYLSNSGLFIEGNLGAGINGYSHKPDAHMSIPYSAYYSYYDKLDAFLYGHAALGFGHTKEINNRWMIRNHVSFGVRNSPFIHNTSVHSNSEGTTLVYLLTSPTQKHFILRGESDFGLRLKNNNVLELGIFYTFTDSPVYKGSYLYPSDESSGEFENYGRELGITLNYIFTGFSKRLERYASSDTPNNNTRQRHERRIYHKSSWLLGIRAGPHWARFIVDNNSTLESAAFAGKHFGFNFNYSSSQEYFWEADLSYSGYFEAERSARFKSGNHGDNDFILSLGIGRGYRLTNRRNYNWLNVSGGIYLNVLGKPNGAQNTSTTIGQFTAIRGVSVVRHAFYPTVYLRVSKDFRLGSNSFISLAFSHNEGFYPAIRKTYEASGAVPGGLEMFNSNFNGRSDLFSIGFKQRFNNN